jgi:hypothetical protein
VSSFIQVALGLARLPVRLSEELVNEFFLLPHPAQMLLDAGARLPPIILQKPVESSLAELPDRSHLLKVTGDGDNSALALQSNIFRFASENFRSALKQTGQNLLCLKGLNLYLQ